MERKIVPLHSWSVAIVSAENRLQVSTNILSEMPPLKEDIFTSGIYFTKSRKKVTKIEGPVLVKTSGRSLMTIEMPRDQNNMKFQLPSRGKEGVGGHCAFLLLVTNVSGNPVVLYKHRHDYYRWNKAP